MSDAGVRRPSGDPDPGDREPGDLAPGDLAPGGRERGDREQGDRAPGDLGPGDLGPGDLEPNPPVVSYRREILRLAGPAFLALIAEPLFLLADSAIVGHLGTAELAGLGVASAALLTASGIFVFLAYGTTSVVARHLGAGDQRAAVSAGIDGLWLALGLGVVVAAVTAVAAGPISALFGASDAAQEQATIYLRISAFGLPAMLIVLAVTGVLRGLQDTKTPLIASVAGFGTNVVLNFVFVYGLHWGIAGSAWGTVIAQTGMAVALVVVLLRKAQALGASPRAHPGRVLAAGLTGIPLLVRTAALRTTMLLTTWVAASLGDATLAAHQVALTIWSFLAFALDALAIAAQAMTGKSLGSGDRGGVRQTMDTMVRWGVLGGLAVGLLLVAVHRIVPPLFTTDPVVRDALGAALVVVGLGQAIAGYVFVLDGVLIGAGDGRWLAWGSVAGLVLYLPIILWVRAIGPSDSPSHDVVVLWVAFTAFMVIRGAILGWRSRTDEWMVLGVR